MTDGKVFDKYRRRLQRIVDYLPGHGWAASLDGRDFYLSKSMVEMVGGAALLPSGNSPDFSWKSLLRSDEYEAVAEKWKAAVEAQESFDVEHQVLCRDGEFRWVRSSAKPVRDRHGTMLYWIGVLVDIDHVVRAAEKARLGEEQLRTLLDTIPAPIWAADKAGRPLYSNAAHTSQTGKNIEQLRNPDQDPVDEKNLVLVHPDDRAKIAGSVRHSFATGEPINVKYRKLLADGSHRWVNNKAQALRDEAGDIVRWYGVSFDIDDEVRLQQYLLEREAELKRVLDALPAVIWTVDPEGRPHYYNERFKSWTGTSVEQFASSDQSALSQSAELLVHPEDQPHVISAVRHALASGEPWTQRYRLRKTDGSYGWVEGRMAPLRDQNGGITHWYGLAVDIEHEVRMRAELKQSQDRLTRASQVAGMAELSAAIAHEISQPLATIVASSDASLRWLLTEPANVEKAKASMVRTSLNAKIASDVIARIRKLFQHLPQQRVLQPLNPILLKALELSEDVTSAKRVKVFTELAAGLPDLEVDAVEIQQVLLNLIRNAVDAMEETEQQNRAIWVSGRRDNGNIVISIEDSGPGVSDFEGIFEPFVTTKPEGMGIGLSISRSIVAGYNGRLSVENGNRGARFSFEIPFAQHQESVEDEQMSVEVD